MTRLRMRSQEAEDSLKGLSSVGFMVVLIVGATSLVGAATRSQPVLAASHHADGISTATPTASPTATPTACALGNLAGQVLDKSNNDQPIPGASTYINGPSGTFRPSTDVEGRFGQSDLLAGTYLVGASAIGYDPYIPRDVNVSACGTASVTMRLARFFQQQPTPTPTATPTPIAVTTATVPLAAGWNLIGLPLRPGQPYTAESLLQEITAQGGNALEVDRWYGGGWSAHPRGLPFNDFALENGRGYFVKTTRPSTWTLSGTPSTGVLTIHLPAGWTLLAIPYPSIGTTRDLLQAIDAHGGNGLEVDRWYAGGWSTFLKAIPLNNFTIEPNRGYFVRTDRPSTLVVQ